MYMYEKNFFCENRSVLLQKNDNFIHSSIVLAVLLQVCVDYLNGGSYNCFLVRCGIDRCYSKIRRKWLI